MHIDEESELELTRRFRLASIEKTDPPEDITGGEWYRYVIEHYTSPIHGFHSGTYRSVKQHLEEYVEKLNDRAMYGYSSYTAKKVE